MLKLAHKALIILTLFSFLSFPCVVVEAFPLKNSNVNSMELIQRDVKVNDLDIEPINVQEVKKSVIPDTKKESKKVIGLFIKSMIGVAFCAIVIYVILLFIKKYYGSAFVNTDYEDYESYDLSTPNTKQEALKSFLNRTK